MVVKDFRLIRLDEGRNGRFEYESLEVILKSSERVPEEKMDGLLS